MQQSLFKIYSLGQVVKDIKEDSQYIDVFPVELHPGKTGELSIPEINNTSISDINKTVETIIVAKTTTIKAKWLAIGTPNKLEPPTVCKGETVLLFRYADTDNFFWSTIYNELHLRKREKHTMILSNKESIADGQTQEVLEKSYYITYDTINKFIRLHTDDSDGEFCTYDIEINTKDGFLTVIDGLENEITLDSTLDKLYIKTNKDILTETDNHTRNVTTDETVDIGNNRTSTIGNNKKETIGNKYQIDLKTYAVSNGADELMALLVETMQAVIDIQHTGNLGIPTSIDDGSKSVFADLKSRYAAFM